MTDTKVVTPWLEPNKTRARRSNQHERRIAEELGGKREKRSGGAYWSDSDRSRTDGGDIITDAFYLEHKRTDKKSLSVKREWLQKISQAALMKSRDPGVILTFEDTRATGGLGSKRNEDWALIPMSVLQRLMRREDE